MPTTILVRYVRVHLGYSVLADYALLDSLPVRNTEILAGKNQEEECKEVLKWIYHPDYVEEVLTEKKMDLGRLENNASIVSADSLVQPNTKTTIKRNKLRFAVAIHLAMLQQFVGINAVVIYGT